MRTTLLAFSLALLSPVAAHAAEPPQVSEVVVTATRLPATLAQEPDVQVVTAHDIERRQASLAFDVLADLPGVQISHTGAYGGVTSIKLRGASSDKTLVLVDGAEVNDPTSPAGGFDFATLDLAEVDHIEVLSGPQGSLWGSDAIGGVISITTREPDGLRALGEIGAHGTERAAGSAGLSTGAYALGAGAAWLSSGGVSKADSRDGNTERDGFRSFTAQVNGRLTPADWLSLDGKLRYNTSHAAFDSFGGPTGVVDGPDSQDGRTASGYLRARIKGPLGVEQELRADGMDMDRTSQVFFGGLFPFEAKGRRLHLRWTAGRSDLGPNAVLVGVEREAASEDTGDGRQNERNWGAFAVWRFTPSERLSASFSLRRDDPRDFAAVTTFRGSTMVRLGAGFTLGGAWGQGFKAPSIFQRTYPCFECAVPGPASGLKPERAQGWDASLAWRSPGGRLGGKVTAYRLGVRDQIDYIYPQGYLNIARTRTWGVEVQADADLGHGVVARAAYADADAQDLSTGLPLLRVPRNKASAGLEWTHDRWQGSLDVRGQSQAADVFGEIQPFVVADLAGAYAVTRNVSLTARIENVANRHYQEAFGYGEPGFGAFVGLRLRN